MTLFTSVVTWLMTSQLWFLDHGFGSKLWFLDHGFGSQVWHQPVYRGQESGSRVVFGKYRHSRPPPINKAATINVGAGQ